MRGYIKGSFGFSNLSQTLSRSGYWEEEEEEKKAGDVNFFTLFEALKRFDVVSCISEFGGLRNRHTRSSIRWDKSVAC